jgi:ketosteroid isomerase-like protein
MTPEPPGTLVAYFEADARRDVDAVVSLFTDDAIVVDERQTWRGTEEIRAWREGPVAKYEYTTEIASVKPSGENGFRASGRLDGNFPGGTVELKWDFTLRGDLISRLEIAP